MQRKQSKERQYSVCFLVDLTTKVGSTDEIWSFQKQNFRNKTSQKKWFLFNFSEDILISQYVSSARKNFKFPMPTKILNKFSSKVRKL